MENKTDPGCLEDLRILTRQLLTNAQAILDEIQEMVERCNSIRTWSRRSHRGEQRVCAATIQEDGETLVIDGFRFEDAASREDQGKQSTTRQNKS